MIRTWVSKYLGWILCIVLILLLCKGWFQLKQANRLVETSQADVKVYKDSENKWHASRQIYLADISMLKSLRDSKDSTIAALAKKVNHNSISHTATQMVQHDTLWIPNFAVETDGTPCDTNPTYEYRQQNAFMDLHISASRGKAMVDLQTFHELNVDVKWEREHWYAKKKAIVDVSDSNPNSKVVNVQNLTVAPKNEKLPFLIGVALGAIGVIGIQSIK